MEHLENPQPTEEELKIREIVKDELFRYSQQQTASQNGYSESWDMFRKQSEYIQLLVQVQGTAHNVHKELEEAIEKIKELTYAERT